MPLEHRKNRVCALRIGEYGTKRHCGLIVDLAGRCGPYVGGGGRESHQPKGNSAAPPDAWVFVGTHARHDALDGSARFSYGRRRDRVPLTRLVDRRRRISTLSEDLQVHLFKRLIGTLSEDVSVTAVSLCTVSPPTACANSAAFGGIRAARTPAPHSPIAVPSA